MPRLKTDAAAFLESHHIITYLQDSIAQLLLYKDENPKVNVKKFFSDYFACVRDSNHTLYRKYEFISATPHNRASFVRTFWKAFRHLGKRGDLLSLAEYHSLLQLLCPDFPFDLVMKVGRIVLQDDAIDCLVSFPDFLFAFQIQFLYSEFVARCLELHEALANGDHASTLVVMPNVGESSSAMGATASVRPTKEQSTSGSVSTAGFMRLLQGLIDRNDICAPNLNTIKKVFENVKEISYYEFLITLCKSEEINADIGILDLDAKSDSDEEKLVNQELEKYRPPQLSPSVRPGTASRSNQPTPSSTSQPTRSRPGTAGKGRSVGHQSSSSSVSSSFKRRQAHAVTQRRNSSTGPKRTKKPVITTDEDEEDDDSSTVGSDSDSCASSASDDGV